MRFRLTSRYIPQGSRAVNHPKGEDIGVAYVHDSGDRFYAIGYKGKAFKSSFNYVFRSAEKRDLYVNDFFAGLDHHAEAVIKARADRLKPHTLKVGDVITNSWGYDQTNVDWYRITKTTTHFVWLKPIASSFEASGHMAGYETPVINTEGDDQTKWGFVDSDGPEEKHAATGDRVSMKYGSGSKWDGKQQYSSYYA